MATNQGVGGSNPPQSAISSLKMFLHQTTQYDHCASNGRLDENELCMPGVQAKNQRHKIVWHVLVISLVSTPQRNSLPDHMNAAELALFASLNMLSFRSARSVWRKAYLLCRRRKKVQNTALSSGRPLRLLYGSIAQSLEHPFR